MGFTLKLENVPSGAVRWNANFAGNTFAYSPLADSGWHGTGEAWDYPSDPRGCTTLQVTILDANNSVLLNVQNLGPVNDGEDYVFDCSARVLTTIGVTPPVPVHIGFIDHIFSFVWDISQFFLDAYLEVEGWVWPFYYLQYPLYGLYRVFWAMLNPIAEFSLWADDVATKTAGFLSGLDLEAWFKDWKAKILYAGNWIGDAFENVWAITEDWWDTTRETVLAWIDWGVEKALATKDDLFDWLIGVGEAWENFSDMIPSISEAIDWFSDWRGNVRSAINIWWRSALGDVMDLINSAFTEREGFWAGWQDFRDKVADFFTDPLEFLWTLFADWFLGPEE